jgi:hypothetical protein
MARARNIKPGFFKNEDLGTADPYVQILFAGLWTLADRDGILEDRPLRIKAEIFPYREGIEVNGYLTQLVSFGLIHRYEVDGVKYIQVCKFKEHQNPHNTEKASVFPSYTDICKLTVKHTLNNVTNPADSLIPDSLNTDSLIPELGAQKTSRPAKGTRLPEDWKLPRNWGEWAQAERPEFNAEQIRKEGEKFKDHWVANSNRREGKKADWFAAWRNWFRSARVGTQGFQTKNERIAENNSKAIAEFVGEEKTIEGEVIDGR